MGPGGRVGPGAGWGRDGSRRQWTLDVGQDPEGEVEVESSGQ